MVHWFVHWHEGLKALSRVMVFVCESCSIWAMVIVRSKRTPYNAALELKPWLEPPVQGDNWTARKVRNWVWYNVRPWDPVTHAIAVTGVENGVVPPLRVVGRKPNWVCISTND